MNKYKVAILLKYPYMYIAYIGVWTQKNISAGTQNTLTASYTIWFPFMLPWLSPHLQLCPLLRGHDPQGCDDQPAALIVLDVGADLSCDGRVTITVQIVVLQEVNVHSDA